MDTILDSGIGYTKGELQIEILKLVGSGTYTQKTLVKSLGYGDDYSSVSKAIRILKEKREIQEVGSSFPWGSINRPKFGLTKKGFERLIKFLEPMEFWQVIFFITDKTFLHGNLEVKLDDIFLEYEKNTLKFSKDRYAPLSFINNLEEFRSLSLKKKVYPLENPSIPAILDCIVLREHSTLSEIYEDLKNNYPKIYQFYMCVECKKKWPVFHRIMHQNMDLLEETLEMMKEDELIKEEKTSYYKLNHAGLILYLYFLFHELDPKTHYTLSIDELRNGLDKRKKLTEGELSILKKIPLIIKHNKNLLPAILYDQSRLLLDINDYYLLYILVLVNFEIHRDFFFKYKLRNYLTYSQLEQLMQNDTQEKLERYFQSGMSVLESLIDQRNHNLNFISKLSHEYFKTNEEFHKKIQKNYRKKHKDLFNHKKTTKNPFKVTNEHIARDLVFDAEWILKLKDEKVPKNMIEETKKDLPKVSDQKVIEEMIDVFKKLVDLNEKERSWGRGHLARSFDYFYPDHEERIKDKITFDFFLLYRNLEPKKWEENFGTEFPLRRWHDERLNIIKEYGKEILLLNIRSDK